ncbi:LysR family transcriptional regulator [Azoarcus indigens]|uniref:DNA-binding transcriptional LysR family regulator n=1 Tax=Azoarcus indigens TaxID=29545 RepID=A0A4R6DGC7_9RHOO|nr:LysR family transcriptional regulator [Azoarcus indigens]NMG67897.1 LysR family transcriptional regulator [Azoarcus indigens]TDN43078.1 DNA-binding transcriptional LysR family regulator [Azoarcus indigens]
MDRFDSLRLFTRIVELGSFTKAAAALDMPRATATYVIKELEDRLGARLLERTTRQVRPTADGQAFYQRCTLILADLEDAEAALRPAAGNPQGLLRLDLHGAHASQIILPRIQDFRRRYPRIELRISTGDRLVDLVGEGVDCVVRAGVPRDSSLVARRLALLPEAVCASPAYLAEFGTPAHPDELARHLAVGFFSHNPDQHYPFRLQVDGQAREYRLKHHVAVSDADAYTTCALQGCGLIQVPRFRVEPHLQTGALVEILQPWQGPPLPISVLYPSQRHLSPRVKAFVDWVSTLYTERFGPPG